MQQISKIQSLDATNAAVSFAQKSPLGTQRTITASKGFFRPLLINFFNIFWQPCKVKANYSFGLFTGLLLEVCWCQKVCLTQPVVNYFFGQVFAAVGLRPKLHGMHKPHFNGDMACPQLSVKIRVRFIYEHGIISTLETPHTLEKKKTSCG